MQENESLLEELIVAIPNERGSLRNLCESLSKASINLLGFSLDVPGEIGFIRLIVDKIVLTKKILLESDLKFNSNYLLAVSISHEPGGFFSLTKIYDEIGENIDYCYHLISMYDECAVVCFQSKNQLKMYNAMIKKGFKVLNSQKIQLDL